MTSTLQTENRQVPRSLSKLWVPEYSEPQEDFFLADLERVETWVSGLPMANVSEAASRVLDALVDFNRQEIPNKTRIKIAELFRQPIHYITQNLEKHYIDAALPLTAKSRRSIRLSQELYAELAVSYKVFIREAFTHHEKSSKRLVAIAIHRAMTCLSDILHLATLEYDQYPECVWQESHFLYALAAKNSIHRLPIQDRIKTASGSRCTGDLYKRLLLHTLASPCYLRQRENRFVYEQLLEWANFVRLAAPDINGDNGGQFLVRLSSDTPPKHVSCEQKKLSKRCRILDTQRLIDHLNERLLAANKPQSQPSKEKLADAVKLSKPILEHLITNLSGRPKRKFSRTKLGYTLKLAVGIPHVHNLVKTNNTLHDAAIYSGGSKANIDWLDQHIPRNYASPDEPESDWSDSSSLLLNLDLEADSTISNVSGRSFDTGTMLEDNVQSPWAINYNQTEAAAYECKTRNESAGGYCIDWGDTNAPKIKPGELIGIQSPTTGRHFGVATTRWIKHTPENKLQMGMQLIAPNSFAVEVRLDDESKISCVYNSLLVPESKFAKIPLSLIVPTNSYQEGDVLWINSGSNELRVCLTQLLSATTSFSQYQITHHSQ